MTNVADSMFSSLSEQDLAYVEDQLSSNAAASTEQLRLRLVDRGLSDAQATQALRYRELYRTYTFHKDHTPIRKSKHALRLNHNLMIYELVPC